MSSMKLWSMKVNPLRAAEMRPFFMKEVKNVPEFHDWQRAGLLNQIISNIEPSDKSGFYRVDMNLSARQCDLLQDLANVFDALARAQGGPPPVQDQGGD